MQNFVVIDWLIDRGSASLNWPCILEGKCLELYETVDAGTQLTVDRMHMLCHVTFKIVRTEQTVNNVTSCMQSVHLHPVASPGQKNVWWTVDTHVE